MKVHVTVDESIYPELHELLEATPVSKRARVLANLAFKACLLNNVALMNAELTTPSRGRNSSSKKKNSTATGKNRRDDSKTDKPVFEDRSGLGEDKKEKVNNGDSVQPIPQLNVNEQVIAGGENTSENTSPVVNIPTPVRSDGTGVPERNSGSGDASDQQINADGEGSKNSAPQVPNTRKRRILG
ncbi:hypothetical protein J7S78_13425 [Klebsiella oxytoca]|uniref:Uncharacterized protein n=1 Tax=Klebsiella oxytoca TaxID=571 RepID=A0AAP2FLH5_KLEOX|nr:hypothetical protein [Klebsiella oxytoca]MBQ0600792.1 hypothetical protein [Klebsiella oxytoca]